MNDLAVILRPAVLSRLRTETRDLHNDIEQTLDLMDDKLTYAGYVNRLKQFYGFYRPIEEKILDASSPLAQWIELSPRRKSALLEVDLYSLSNRRAVDLPICEKLPPLKGIADYFGCMYVLEGASLGGQIISRHIQKKIGVTRIHGGRFFNGYGDRTGAMWQEFRSAISDFSLATNDDDAVVASARATFKSLQLWCQRNIEQ